MDNASINDRLINIAPITTLDLTRNIHNLY